MIRQHRGAVPAFTRRPETISPSRKFARIGCGKSTARSRCRASLARSASRMTYNAEAMPRRANGRRVEEGNSGESYNIDQEREGYRFRSGSSPSHQPSPAGDEKAFSIAPNWTGRLVPRCMPHWRLQPAWPAVLSLHGSAARSRRPMLRLWERRLSIPHSLLFGDGCRGRAGTADEDDYPAVTAEGMAGSDLATRRPYRVRARDGLRLRGRGDQLYAGDGTALCCCLWSRCSLSGDGHGVVAPPSTRRRAPMMIASEHCRSASGPGSFDHRATFSGQRHIARAAT